MVRRTRSQSAVTPASSADMRQPIQPRAQATIDRICDAAVAVLSEGGWDAFNTNVVAVRAEVSGPTVYRYFPNKYVLAAELRRRLDAAEHAAALPAIARIGDAGDVAGPVAEWVEATVGVRGGHPAARMLRSVSAAVPDLSRSGADPDEIDVALTLALRRRHGALAPGEAAERAQAIRTSVDSLIDALPEGSPDAGRIDLIVDLGTAMIESSAAPTRSLAQPAT